MKNNTQIKCGINHRREIIKQGTCKLNGIDYIEVYTLSFSQSDGTDTMCHPFIVVYFFKPISEFRKDNLLIEGGVRIKNINILWAGRASELKQLVITNNVVANQNNFNMILKYSADQLNSILEDINKKSDSALVVFPDKQGDFSIYTIRLVKDRSNPEIPPDGYDILLSRKGFSFKVECSDNLDCKPEKQCMDSHSLQNPTIDYMAKDFASFRRLMLDRLSQIIPSWKERNPADVGIVLVELLSYIGDHLSYLQDAVGTETYLGTARKRISVRRHARLLDYFIKEGCNSRAWVCIDIDRVHSGTIVPKGTRLLTSSDHDSNNKSGIIVNQQSFKEALRSGAEAFETMYNITLFYAHNSILFYNWGDSYCCLPVGSTHATLRNDDGGNLEKYLFTWNNVPGNEQDNNELRDFLKHNFNLGWIDELPIEKPTDDTTILISDNVHQTVSIILDNKKSKAVVSVNGNQISELLIHKDNQGKLKVYTPSLKVGDILIFEEIISPTTKKAADKDIHRRHAVRLKEVVRNEDKLYDPPIPVIEIEWHYEDALPFPLCICIPRNRDDTDYEDKGGSNNNRHHTLSEKR